MLNVRNEDTPMSDDTKKTPNRRRFIKLSVMGIALAPMTNLLFNQNAHAFRARSVSSVAVKIPRLPENDRQAMALGYKEDAALVDTDKYKVADGANCRNCQLYSGSDEDQWGPCAIFSYRIHPLLNQNFVVNAKGWCRSWAMKAG